MRGVANIDAGGVRMPDRQTREFGAVLGFAARLFGEAVGLAHVGSVLGLDEVLERIELMPEMYGVVWQNVRAAWLRRFRHVVYDVAFADRIEVLAVLHGTRDAYAWPSGA